ncbi:DMT family transporter [Phreatobacter sp. AB_2022a]|uniref:DMT family transporter n=1 Tax=Phreatobacter sp. AB_2022a TaxID=3003134 RepID=UPI002286D67B|nr:EamA family transporter [Phreatobacter sp. AB_2022a]MCZ0737948.1 EamA family transporter [Phreatobacter sp. AB_2022a]
MSSSNETWLGTLMIVGSAAAYSLAGYFTRLIELDVWTILFWRGLFGGLLVGLFAVLSEARGAVASVRAMGVPGLWVMGLSTFATVCFVGALRLAPVADVITIQAAAPLLTAFFGLILGGEREGWTTWAASVAALAGVTIVLNPSGAPTHGAGHILAVAMTLSYAAMMVIIRRNRHASMLPAAYLSALLCVLVAWPLGEPAAVTSTDLILLALFGTVQFGLGLLLLTLGARLVSSMRAALIGILENPLAPLWVWLAFGERPTAAAWLGGGIITAAVLADAAVTMRRCRQVGTTVAWRSSAPPPRVRWRLSEVRRVMPTAEDIDSPGRQ